jgi:hypothetical protein
MLLLLGGDGSTERCSTLTTAANGCMIIDSSLRRGLIVVQPSIIILMSRRDIIITHFMVDSSLICGLCVLVD